MKVICIKDGGGFDNLVVEERSIREPGKGMLKIRWHATSLNYHDLLVAKGAIPVADGRIPMSDAAGEVIETGPDVKSFKVGDRVMPLFFPNWQSGSASIEKIRSISGESLDGYMCEESVLHEDQITSIPEHLSYEEAACLPCAALTAWHALFEIGKVQEGDKVMVQGTGGMSMFAFQLAKAAGAEVYASSSSGEKADRLIQMGAKECVNYASDATWGKTIFKKSNGGVNHVIDAGGGSTMKQSIEAAALNARIYSIGILGNGRKGEITFPKLFFKFLNLHGLAVGSRVMQCRMVHFLEMKSIYPIIDKSFEFDQLAEAFRYQESGKHFGKIVLKW